MHIMHKRKLHTNCFCQCSPRFWAHFAQVSGKPSWWRPTRSSPRSCRLCRRTSPARPLVEAWWSIRLICKLPHVFFWLNHVKKENTFCTCDFWNLLDLFNLFWRLLGYFGHFWDYFMDHFGLLGCPIHLKNIFCVSKWGTKGWCGLPFFWQQFTHPGPRFIHEVVIP